MSLPKSIQAQLDAAEALQEQMAATQGDAPEVTQPEPAPGEVSETPEVQPQPVQPSAQPESEKWEQRYRILQGKYDAEVPRLSVQLREANAEAELLKKRMEALEAKLVEQAAPKPQESRLVTDEDTQSFGADMIDVMRRTSREELAAERKRVDELEKLVRSLSKQGERVQAVEAEVHMSREEKFWSDLDAAVPDWKAVNTDERWIAWLGSYDPVAGVTRQVALDHAQGQLNLRRVAAFFEQFKASLGTPAPTPAPVNNELLRQAAPSKSSGSGPTPVSKPTVPGTEYTYWLDHRRVNDTDITTLNAKLAEMETALNEGRVRW